MLAEMSNIYWPTGVAFVILLFLFYIGRRVDQFWETYQATRKTNAHLEDQAYDMAMKIVELETRVALTTAEAEVARRQLTHLTNAAVAIAHNRRIRRQDMTDADGFARKFELVQRRRRMLADTLEKDLAELLGTSSHHNGKDGENIALTAMVREAIRMSKEDPDFGQTNPPGKPHEFDSNHDRQHNESVLDRSLDRSARFSSQVRTDSTGGREAQP